MTFKVKSGVEVNGALVINESGQVDGRDVAADGSKLDGIEAGATADQTAAEILTAVKTVDGSGSGLDADTLDGIQGASYLRSDANDTFTGQLTVAGNLFLNNTNTKIEEGSGNSVRVRTNSGYLDLGPQNTNWSHFNTDRSAYHFNKPVHAVGKIQVYNSSHYIDSTGFHGDGSNLTGIAAGAGGGGTDKIFWENDQTVTTNYTITNNQNAMSAGPITINSGITVTVGAGETWTVV